MKRFILALILGACSLSAQSALVDRGGGFIYDDALDITWTQNANIRDGEGPWGAGIDSWTNQVAWAANLSLFDSVRNVTWSDWRLPTSLDQDASCDSQAPVPGGISLGYGTGCTGGELEHLFNVDDISFTSPGLFVNINAGYYWTGTERLSSAWMVSTDIGHKTYLAKSYTGNSAWTVRDGDVAAVPIPATVYLFGSALGLVSWMRRRAS